MLNKDMQMELLNAIFFIIILNTIIFVIEFFFYYMLRDMFCGTNSMIVIPFHLLNTLKAPSRESSL